jgi:hypothetical protein
MQILFSTGADEFYFFTAHLFHVLEIAASALLSLNLTLLAQPDFIFRCGVIYFSFAHSAFI